MSERLLGLPARMQSASITRGGTVRARGCGRFFPWLGVCEREPAPASFWRQWLRASVQTDGSGLWGRDLLRGKFKGTWCSMCVRACRCQLVLRGNSYLSVNQLILSGQRPASTCCLCSPALAVALKPGPVVVQGSSQSDSSCRQHACILPLPAHALAHSSHVCCSSWAIEKTAVAGSTVVVNITMAAPWLHALCACPCLHSVGLGGDVDSLALEQTRCINEVPAEL